MGVELNRHMLFSHQMISKSSTCCCPRLQHHHTPASLRINNNSSINHIFQQQSVIKMLWRSCQGHSRASRCQSLCGWIQRCAAWWFTWMGETFREKKWRPTVWEMKDKDAARSARSDMGSFASRWMDVVSVTLLLIYSFATWMFRLSCFLRIPIFPMQ